MTTKLWCAVLGLLPLALAASGACGEGPRGGAPSGTVKGVVTASDTQGPIAGADVTAAGRRATTGADGRYELTGVPLGDQVVAAEATGYAREARSVTVAAGQFATADFALAPTTPPEAGAFYVAPTGDDANAGSRDAPWRTIAHAMETVEPGATVYVRAGVYREHVAIRQRGSPGAYTTLAAHPGETVVVDGADVTASQNGIYLSAAYARVVGLEIRNWGGNAMWVEGASHFEIRDCELHEATYGLGIADGSHDFTVRRVVAHHFDLYGFDVSPSGGPACHDGTFEDCLAYGGRDREQNVDGFALGHGEQHDFEFKRCVAYDVYDGFDVSARRSTLRACLAHDCWNGAYKLWQDEVTLVNCIGYGSAGSNVELDWDGNPGRVTLRNCTFVDAKTFNIWVENAGDSLRMVNCLLAGGDNIGLAFEQPGVGNYEGDHNLFHNDNAERAIAVAYTDEFTLAQVQSGAWASYSGDDAHSVAVTSADGLFVNPSEHDFHLADGSPAVDAGTAEGAPSEDFDGKTRPAGAGYDIGAFER